MRLQTGTKYDVAHLQFICWAGPLKPPNEEDVKGYNWGDYFETDGEYKGPDKYGIEPQFNEIDAERAIREE